MYPHSEVSCLVRLAVSGRFNIIFAFFVTTVVPNKEISSEIPGPKLPGMLFPVLFLQAEPQQCHRMQKWHGKLLTCVTSSTLDAAQPGPMASSYSYSSLACD